MAEKPRLKETDEIFSSIGKGAAKNPPLPGISQPEDQELPTAPEPMIDSLLDDAEPRPASGKRASSRSRRRNAPPRGEVSEPVIDPRPLNFGKYDLKQESVAQQPEEPLVTPPEPPKKADSAPKQKKQREEPARAQEAERQPAPVEQETLAPPPMRRVNTARQAQEPTAPPPPQAAAPAQQQAAPIPPEPAYQPPEQSVPEIKPFVFEELDAPTPPSDAGTKIIRGGGEEAPPLNPQPKMRRRNPVPEPEPQPQPKPQPQPANERAGFLKELSQQFDEAFQSAFDGNKGGDSRRKKNRSQTRERFDNAPKTNAAVDVDKTDDKQAIVEAEAFLHEFEQQVRQEEEVRVELFKDTLSEKFERERERYLRELGIGEEPQPEPEPQAPARRLDIQIEPEMHRAREDRQPDTPVTYTRRGNVRPQTHDVEEEAPLPRKGEASGLPADGKKSSEELLFELARQNSTKRPPPRPMETPAPVPRPVPKAAKPQEQLQFVHVEEEKPKKKGSNRRIIAISAVAAVIVLAVIAFPVIRALNPSLLGTPQTSQPDENSVAVGNEGGRTLEVYEARNFETRESFDNMVIKRANISVRNLSVDKQVVIENIETQGSVRLEDVDVGGELYIRNCAVDTLELHNVTAERLVVTNNQARVNVLLTGTSGIDTIELRTSAVIGSQPTQGADIGGGIRNVMLKAGPETSVLTATLNGVEVQTLASYDDAVLELGPGTRIEQMTTQGSLSVSGTGSILAVAASPKEVGDSLALKVNVPVTQLNLKGTGQVEVESQVDMLATSDSLTLSGQGKIAKLVLDRPVSGGRLMLDISDVGVQLLIANAETRVITTGEARITELTANESVYALGNKVNLLVVNANRVIYENEPDKIQVTTGIRPPESVADNPNLDYNLSSEQMASPPDTELDDVSTVCGHTRESGGFLIGEGSSSNPYRVTTPAQLAHVGAHLNVHYVQTADIDISADTQFVSGFPMIANAGAPFTGSYNGGGFAISNLRVNSNGENVGLFAENSGTIQNISLVSGEVRGTSAERSYVGGICGLNYQGGTISSCSNGARVVGSENAYVGGIAGYNFSGRIRDSYNAAKITGTINVGGITGVNRDDSTVSSCYNVGTIEGGDTDTGAIAGVNSGVVTNTYYLEETAEKGIGTGSGTATSRDTDEMSSNQMVADLSAGLENSPWVKSDSSYTYPLLRKPPTVEPQP